MTLNSETLRRASEIMADVEKKQNEIDTQRAELAQLLAGQIDLSSLSQPLVVTTKTGQHRKFSPEAIAKIQAAQRRRWRKVRKNKAASLGLVSAPESMPAPAPAPEPVAGPVAPIFEPEVPRAVSRPKSKKVLQSA